MSFAPTQDKPGEIRAWKSLRYKSYSDTATIEVSVDRQKVVYISFSGKIWEKPGKA